MSGQAAKSIVLTRRRLVGALAATAVGLALSACTQSTPSTATAGAPPAIADPPIANPTAAAAANTPAAAAAATAPAALRGATVRFGALANYKGDALEKTFPDFEKATGIKVEIDKLPNANLADKLGRIVAPCQC